MNIAIILSGGIGSRLGGNLPKQYIKVAGKPIINYCVETFSHRSDIDMLVFVMAEDWIDYFLKNIRLIQKPYYFARPGITRQLSVYNALNVCKANGVDESDIIIIHDAARPLVTDKIIDQCIKGCQTHDGVLPVINVKDTIYLSQDGKQISTLLDRRCLFAGQSPESFRFGKYLQIHKQLDYDEISLITGSTEIAYKSGLNIKLIKGDEINFKITTSEDLSSFETIIVSMKKNTQ